MNLNINYKKLEFMEKVIVGRSYIIDSYGGKKFSCNKTQVFLDKQDFINKQDKIFMFNLSAKEKEYLLSQFEK